MKKYIIIWFSNTKLSENMTFFVNQLIEYNKAVAIIFKIRLPWDLFIVEAKATLIGNWILLHSTGQCTMSGRNLILGIRTSFPVEEILHLSSLFRMFSMYINFVPLQNLVYVWANLIGKKMLLTHHTYSIKGLPYSYLKQRIVSN